jgi:hypothetical protein
VELILNLNLEKMQLLDKDQTPHKQDQPLPLQLGVDHNLEDLLEQVHTLYKQDQPLSLQPVVQIPQDLYNLDMAKLMELGLPLSFLEHKMDQNLEVILLVQAQHMFSLLLLALNNQKILFF